MFSARHSNRRTVAVTVVDGMYQEDVANVPVVQPDVSKPAEEEFCRAAEGCNQQWHFLPAPVNHSSVNSDAIESA